MSERMQHTCTFMHKEMSHRYGDQYIHKHDKRHSRYRAHWRTHPIHIMQKEEQLEVIKNPKFLFRAKKKEKLMKRLAKASFH